MELGRKGTRDFKATHEWLLVWAVKPGIGLVQVISPPWPGKKSDSHSPLPGVKN